MGTADPTPWTVLAILLLLSLTAARSVYAGEAAPCQAADWDMSRELKVFATPSHVAAAGNGPSNAPVLSVETLYALRLHEQNDVQFVQPPGHADKVSMPMGGIAHFAVPSGGLYRITVDSPLWIDIVTPSGIITPSSYHGWHECSLFRKSVDYILRSGESVTLQLSGASTDLIKITVEPPLTP